MRGFVVFLFLLLSAGFAQAESRNSGYGEPGDFLGTWHNVEIRKTQVVRIEITPEYDNRVSVRVYGLCHGEPCFFGEERGHLFLARYPREIDQDNAAILVKVHKDFVKGAVLIRFNGKGEIVSHAVLHFEDERGDVYSVERFAPIGDEYEGEGYHRSRRPYYRGY